MSHSPDIYQRIVAAKLYIDNNFTENIDLEQISRQAYLSRFHFHRLFRRIYKKTPHQYLTSKRMERARTLLTANDLTISEVSAELGFESPATFSNLFRKQSGMAPQNYRSASLQLMEDIKTQPKRFIPHCFINQYQLEA
jgi:AraC-like DNA-binding protein